MASRTCASFCLIVCFLVCSSEAQTNITAEIGKDFVLPCKVPNNKILITAVEWIRPEMKKGYVLFYRDGRFDPENQHPSYQNRVDLQDKEMKDGNFSLVLKNITKNDSGRYECYVHEGRKNELISIINLEVLLSGKLDENSGDKVGITRGHHGLVGCVILLLLAVFASVCFCFLTFRNHRRQNPNIPVPPDEAAAEQML